jgi:hypothetical protein
MRQSRSPAKENQNTVTEILPKLRLDSVGEIRQFHPLIVGGGKHRPEDGASLILIDSGNVHPRYEHAVGWIARRGYEA